MRARQDETIALYASSFHPLEQGRCRSLPKDDELAEITPESRFRLGKSFLSENER